VELLGCMAYLILVASLFSGTILLVSGLRGRKVDDFPYCRECRYNLTGLTGQRCPECGSLTTETGVIIGRRRRRPRLIVAGLLLCIPTMAVLIGAQTQWARSVNWYQKLPTWWVFKDQQSDNRKVSYRAGDELKSRFLHGEMNQKQIQRLADLAVGDLTATATPRCPFLADESLSHAALTRLVAGGHFSPGQYKAVFESMFQVQMSANPRSLRRDGIPIGLRIKHNRWIPYSVSRTTFLAVADKNGKTPTLPPFPPPAGVAPRLSRHHLPQALEPLTEQAHEVTLTSLSGPSGGEAWDSFTFVTDQVGLVELHFLVCVDYAYRNAEAGTVTPLHRMVQPVIVRSNVLEAPMTDVPRLVRDPALTGRMREAIQVSEIRNNRSPPKNGLSLWVTATNPPVDGAMEVSLENGQNRQTIGETIFRAGKTSIVPTASGPCPDWVGANVTVILTPKPEITYRTVETIDRIWGEEMRFENVAVHTDPAE